MYDNKVNGKAFSGEFLTANLQFYALSTSVDITGASANSQKALDKLVEVISLNGQPVILGGAKGTGPYTLSFVIEHTGAWNTANTLVDAIKAHAPMFTADASLSVVIGETL